MTLESIPENADKFGEILDRTTKPLRQASVDASHAICTEAKHALACATEQIRKNPVPIVVGAVAFGVAIGYLIVSGRQTDTFHERYVDEPLAQATDAISSTFNRLYGNLKFW